MSANLASPEGPPQLKPSRDVNSMSSRFADQHGMLRHLTIPECMALTGLSKSSVYRALRREQLVAVKAGNRVLVPVANLQKYIADLPRAVFTKIREGRR